MKIVQITHFRNNDESETSDYVWYESNNQEELMKKLKRICELLINFEGLQCIAKCPEEHWATFAEGLSKDAYWVRVSIVK